MKKLKAAALLVLAIAAVACLTACGSKSIDLNKYVTITTSGYDTMGKAHASFDEEAFAADCGGTLNLTDTGKSYARWYDSDVELLLDCISGSLDTKSGLSNGDTITYSWSIDLDDIEELFSNVKVKYSDMTYTVSGLEDIITFDAFEGVSVSFSGTSPNASASLNVSNSMLDESDYSLTKSSGLANGEVVTVTVHDSSVDALLQEKGACPESTSKEFTVEGLPYYASSLDQIPSDGMEKLLAQVQDVLASYTASMSTEAFRLDSVEYLGNYFLSRKQSDSSGAYNIIYFVYEINTTVYDVDEDLNEADFPNTYYWYVKFTDGIVQADGTFFIDYSSYERPSFSLSWGIASGDGFTMSSHYEDSGRRYSRTLSFSGFQDLDSMFSKLVSGRSSDFYYESTVADN